VAFGLLTRFDEISDFASDACVRREGLDSATGRRYLQEIAFLVMSEVKKSLAAEKAARMHRRGVRRIFALWVDSREVGEWSAEHQNWRLMEANSRIEDSCFVAALEIAALFDAEAADNAVVEALAAKGNPAILARDAAAEAKGRAEGTARSVLSVLEARAVSVTAARRQQVLRCQDLERLGIWLRRAVIASSAAEVLAET
jgi:hypothetical protein